MNNRETYTAKQLKERADQLSDKDIQVGEQWGRICGAIEDSVRYQSYIGGKITIAVGCGATIFLENQKRLEDLGYKVENTGGTVSSVNIYF